MFESLSQRLGDSLSRLTGRGRLSEEHVGEAMREVRRALLEADVSLPVVHDFVERVRSQAIGQAVLQSLTPGQEVVRIVRDELTALMGEANVGLALNTRPPAVILVAGLQGAGKTTTVAKLARYLAEQDRKKVMVVSCDVYRPAAINSLKPSPLRSVRNFSKATRANDRSTSVWPRLNKRAASSKTYSLSIPPVACT